MDNNCADVDYNSEDRVEHGDTFLSSSSELIPDLNSNHFASMASTHSSHSVSIESLEDSIADAKNKKVLQLCELPRWLFSKHLLYIHFLGHITLMRLHACMVTRACGYVDYT